ncbi:MAG TPA: MBL fold metallo-hydrolase [Candidatus Brocadiia bacterium]|nr:MBL fold metallo-hydrolase [Candidatus Brocadiia bacterium]
MKLTDEVHIIGGGANGIGMTDRYDCNVFLINGGEQLALVDTGANVSGMEFILSNVEAEGFRRHRISYLLLTHCHADHCGGAGELRQKLGLRVCIHQEEADILKAGDEKKSGLAEARADGYYPKNYQYQPCDVDIALKDMQTINVGYLAVTAIHIPGHSAGSVCYMFRGKDSMCLLTGDTVFCGGKISLLNCSGSSLTKYRKNLSKLSNLGIDALLPGHYGFTLRYGQEHLDKAIEAMGHMTVPPNV